MGFTFCHTKRSEEAPACYHTPPTRRWRQLKSRSARLRISTDVGDPSPRSEQHSQQVSLVMSMVVCLSKHAIFFACARFRKIRIQIAILTSIIRETITNCNPFFASLHKKHHQTPCSKISFQQHIVVYFYL